MFLSSKEEREEQEAESYRYIDVLKMMCRIRPSPLNRFLDFTLDLSYFLILVLHKW